MPHELARRRPIPGAMIPARTTPIATAAAANGMGSKRRPLGRLSRTRSAFTTWLAMSASGLRMFGTAITRMRQRTDRPGSKVLIPRAVSSAAVPGAAIHRTSARPAAAARNILVCNVPDYGTTEVADHAMALALSLRRGVILYHERQRRDPPAPWGPVKGELIRRLGVPTFGIVVLRRVGTARA